MAFLGTGSIVTLSDTETPTFEIVKHMNFDDETRASVTSIPWDRLEPQFDEGMF
jgi:hypothetical protein